MMPDTLVEKFDYDKHGLLVTNWGAARSFQFPPKDMLPDIGFIVQDRACGFLYSTNSKLAWVEWVAANPDKSKEERAEALDIVLTLLETTAKQLGFKALFSASALNGYAKVLERNGFHETDNEVSHFVKLIGED